eukprot:TRINITY_DN5097_c0_g1_i3.p1 TRINITY_DN5097_c0_g1~~TRINITY_DN5097_c0_g1_i3.p1  ORF type:complete len:595 (-),score=209.04 TRINITY_DN5097_c0_g1_i3:89-1837(-)
MTFIPSLDKVLITGFRRRDGMPCRSGPRGGPNGSRAAGITFLLDVRDLPTGDPTEMALVNAQLVDEAAEFPFGIGFPQATYDGWVLDGDAAYCTGHTTLPDGRVFYVGGGRYSNLSQPIEHEWGIDYARLFDPKVGSFLRVPFRMPMGRAWYPTASLLPNGLVLVTGGFSDYGTDFCLGASCLNPQINLFNVTAFDRGLNPWTVLINATYADHDIDPNIREYTRVFVLPTPVTRGNIRYDVLLMGKIGRVVLLSTDMSVPMSQRMYKPPGGNRPTGDTCGGDRSDQSTAVPLLTRGGEIAVLGGCWADQLQRIHVYNVLADSWTSVNTGIPRRVAASNLLPDGRIVLVNGENPTLDQNLYGGSGGPISEGSGDPRYVQIFDPYTMTVSTEAAPIANTVFRGYHNTLAVLSDGAILVGGGFNQMGDVGCENPSLQIFRPSYLFTNTQRPAFASQEPFVVAVGQTRVSRRLGAPIKLHPTRGVGLLAASSFTHAYDHAQRYVPVVYRVVEDSNGMSVEFDVPPSPMAYPGQYRLFLVSADGVPSHGIATSIVPAPDSPKISSAVNLSLGAVTLLLASTVLAILL